MSIKTNKVVEQLSQFKIIPMVNITNINNIIPLANILINNNLPVIEITLRSEESVEAIRILHEKYPEMLIGAGTVLSFGQVKEAEIAGVNFIVSPGFNPKVIDFCQEEGLSIIPGVNNPMAIEAAFDKGLTAMKFFPAEASGGIDMIKSLLGPYSQLQLMPVGGINIDNINDYLAIPQVFACGCSWFVDEKLIENQDWDEIERLLQEILDKIN